jgi:hypothetical protein
MLKGALEHPPPATRNWLQAWPEQTVVHDEKIDAGFSCFLKGNHACVDRCADFRDGLEVARDARGARHGDNP